MGSLTNAHAEKLTTGIDASLNPISVSSEATVSINGEDEGADGRPGNGQGNSESGEGRGIRLDAEAMDIHLDIEINGEIDFDNSPS